MNKQTNENKGIAFIHFYNKDDMQYAIENVSGARIGHNILGVEKAKQRK